MATLQTSFPWVQNPLIVNAPMGGIAGSKLALAASRAGGLGLMGMDPAGTKFEPWLADADKSLQDSPIPLFAQHTSDNTASKTTADLPYLPLGIGFLVTFMKLELVMRKLTQRTENNALPPAVVWLFAADEPSIDAYATWATAIRSHYGSTNQHVPQIWIQVGGSAAAAVKLATSAARPDVLVVQGSDAGGHGMERGASIVGLLPETQCLLDRAFPSDVAPSSMAPRKPHLLASGGIVNAAGALAAFALGAEGVVMGTRFLASPETAVPHPEYRARVLAATDGAQSTIRAKVFDELAGPNVWPVAYDGRALVSRSWRDRYEAQVPIETVRDGFAKAVREEDGGYSVESDRAVVWCGTGVGLVNEMMPAGEVVVGVREGVKALMEEMRRRLESKL